MSSSCWCRRCRAALPAALQPRLQPDRPFGFAQEAFSKLKALLKKTAARTVDDLYDAIAQGIDAFTPAECHNYFAAAGYDSE